MLGAAPGGGGNPLARIRRAVGDLHHARRRRSSYTCADAVPGRIYKLTLDGKVARRARRGGEGAEAVRLDSRDRVSVGERAVCRRAAQLARAEAVLAALSGENRG